MQIRNTLLLLSTAICLILGFQNCSAYHEGQGSANGASASSALVATGNGKIGFDAVKAAIFDVKCIGCHSGSRAPNLSSYAALIATANMVIAGNPQGSTLYRRSADGSMPPGSPLTTVEIKAINDWIQQGAIEVSVADTTGASGGAGTLPINTAPPEPTFANVNARIFQPYCISCHNAQKADGGYNLSTYASILQRCVRARSTATSKCYTEIVNGNMPPNGTILDANIQLLKAWIDAGALNN